MISLSPDELSSQIMLNVKTVAFPGIGFHWEIFPSDRTLLSGLEEEKRIFSTFFIIMLVFRLSMLFFLGSVLSRKNKTLNYLMVLCLMQGV